MTIGSGTLSAPSGSLAPVKALATRPGDEAVACVPHETSASPVPAKRKYHSPARRKVAEQKRTALIGAALALIRLGRFRFGAQELADKAGVRRQSIARYFGSVDLLYRVFAREYWRYVAACLPFGVVTPGCEEKLAVWTVMVGKPRELSPSSLDDGGRAAARSDAREPARCRKSTGAA